MSLREDYDLPRVGRGPTLRIWLVMLAVPAIALLAWLLLPSGPIAVAILVVAVLAVVFGGVWWVLHARALERPPSRDPQPRG